MARFKTKKTIFLVLSLSLVFGFLSYYFFGTFLVKAQEEIKIFPVSFSGNLPGGETGWQNPEAAFSQDLGPGAVFEEFNIKNSAHPNKVITIGEKGFWEKIMGLFSLQVQAQSSVPAFAEASAGTCQNGENRPCGTDVGVCQIGVQICEQGVWGKCLGAIMPASEICDEVDNDCDGQIDEGGACVGRIETPVCQNGENRPCGTDVGTCQIGVQICELGVWGKCLGAIMPASEICDEVDNDCDGEIDEGGACEKNKPLIEEIEESYQSVFILSDFSVPAEFKKIKINNAQLRMSLAGMGEVGDKLVIDYSYQDTWENLAIFNLENEISNALNGGYFLYGLPIFESWNDFTNLKIRFTYLSGTNQALPGLVFLEAIWLEVETEEIQKRFVLKSVKQDPPALEASWRRDEEPEFDVEEIPRGLLAQTGSAFKKKEIEAVLIDPQGKEDLEGIIIQDNKIKISHKRSFRPGLYKLKVKIIEGGEVFIQEQNFTWGVLAINTNKSIYLPNEESYLQMAALRDDGHTICDANLILEITPPNYGSPTPIDVNVERSGQCWGNNVTNMPDYFAYYQVEGPGIYQMTLTNLDNGYQITDSFEVRESVPFDIERVGPTRIYPPATYEMKMIVKVNQDFQGQVVEQAPSSFELTGHGTDAKLIRETDAKLIVWQVDWKTGEIHELKYTFDAPDISPYLYLLGPLEFYE